MMKPFTKIASLIFAVVSLGHLLRLIFHAQVIAGSHSIPMWVSIFGFVVAAVLAGGLWRESR